MPADFSRYVDLTIYDSEPTNIYKTAIENARLVMPEFTLRQGTIEDALFQAFSYASSTVVNSINRLPNRLMEGVVSAMGYSRGTGTKSTAVLTVALYGYDGTTISAGTQFRWRYTEPNSSTYQDYVFEVTEDVAIASTTAPTQPSGSVSVKCSISGQIPALSVGDTLTSLSVDTDIESVTVSSFVNGTNPMTDGDYLDGALTFLESLTETFTTARQLQSGILTTFTNVIRCKVYDVTNSLSSTSTAASAAPGYVAVYVYGNGAALTQSELSEIQTWAANRCVAGISITVSNFNLSQPTISISAVVNSKYNQTDAEDEAKVLIAANYNYESWSSDELSVASPQIRANTIAALISQMPEILYVNSVTLTPPAAVSISAISTGMSLNGSATTGYVRFAASNSFVAGQEVDVTTNINTITITAVSPNTALAGGTLNGTLRFTASNSLTNGDIVTITTSSGVFDLTQAVVTGANGTHFTVASTLTGSTTTGTAYYDFRNAIIYAANSTHFVIANTCVASTTSKTGSAYIHFDGTGSTSTSSLVFKNKGFLPNIQSSDVSITTTTEAI